MDELLDRSDSGMWGIRRGRFYDLVICGPARWTLCHAAGGWDCRHRTLVYMSREEALELLLVWGFSADKIWQADDFWHPKSVTTTPKPLKLHSTTLAANLLPPRRALAPFRLGG